MNVSSSEPATTCVSRHIMARRADIYRAFVDRDLLSKWLPPENMTGIIHEFEPYIGGRFRMSLTYKEPAEGPGGKTTDDTDTFEGRFVELVPGERIVWGVEFDSEQPGMSGEMRVIWEMEDAARGTNVTVICENIPSGIRPEDNTAGSESSLRKLAALTEDPARATATGSLPRSGS